jgi:hypothetical protein
MFYQVVDVKTGVKYSTSSVDVVCCFSQVCKMFKYVCTECYWLKKRSAEKICSVPNVSHAPLGIPIFNYWIINHLSLSMEFFLNKIHMSIQFNCRRIICTTIIPKNGNLDPSECDLFQTRSNDFISKTMIIFGGMNTTEQIINHNRWNTCTLYFTITVHFLSKCLVNYA